MSRLSITTKNQAQMTVETLYKDLERRIDASQPGLCPVDLAASFVHMCHAQSCGKCTPCRIGLGQLENLINKVLDGEADEATLKVIEETAEGIFFTADCAIGSEAARMVLKDLGKSMRVMFVTVVAAVRIIRLFPVFLSVLLMWMFRVIFPLSMKADTRMQ